MGKLYRRTLRETEWGSLTPSEGYRWWLMVAAGLVYVVDKIDTLTLLGRPRGSVQQEAIGSVSGDCRTTGSPRIGNLRCLANVNLQGTEARLGLLTAIVIVELIDKRAPITMDLHLRGILVA